MPTTRIAIWRTLSGRRDALVMVLLSAHMLLPISGSCSQAFQGPSPASHHRGAWSETRCTSPWHLISCPRKGRFAAHSIHWGQSVKVAWCLFLPGSLADEVLELNRPQSQAWTYCFASTAAAASSITFAT